MFSMGNGEEEAERPKLSPRDEAAELLASKLQGLTSIRVLPSDVVAIINAIIEAVKAETVCACSPVSEEKTPKKKGE